MMANNDAILFQTPRTRVERYRMAAQRRALAQDPDDRRFSHWPDHADESSPRSRTLGIALLPAMRGRGLAGEVIAGSLAMLRDHGLSRFRAEIDPANAASLRVFERAGFARLKLDTDALGPFWILERD